MKKIIIAMLMISILGSCLPAKTLAGVPQTAEESKILVTNILERLPGAIKDVWQNQALPIWWNMWLWSKPKIQSLWEKFWRLTGQQTPDVKGEFQKEKQEMQNDLWQRFKDLF